MGRPRKKVDKQKVESMAQRMCSIEEISATVGCSESTLKQDRFKPILKRGRGSGRALLRSKQMELAMNGNVTMLIWLGKQYLNQSDKFDVSPIDSDGFQFQTSDESKKEKK